MSDPQWTKHQLGDNTSVNLAANGTVIIKQSTGATVETVHLSAGQIDRLALLLLKDIHMHNPAVHERYATLAGNISERAALITSQPERAALADEARALIARCGVQYLDISAALWRLVDQLDQAIP